MEKTLKLLSLFQVEEEIKSDLYILFFHIVQRIPEYLIHLQVGPQDGNCAVELLSHQVTFNSELAFGPAQVQGPDKPSEFFEEKKKFEGKAS